MRLKAKRSQRRTVTLPLSVHSNLLYLRHSVYENISLVPMSTVHLIANVGVGFRRGRLRLRKRLEAVLPMLTTTLTRRRSQR